MKPIPLDPETERVARRVIWFEPPVEALADPVRFMAYAMSHAMPDDMKVIRRYVSDDDFREALDRAPPGIIDPRSWAYWNSKLGRFPPPSPPKRQFGSFVGQHDILRGLAAAVSCGSKSDVGDFNRLNGYRSPAPQARSIP